MKVIPGYNVALTEREAQYLLGVLNFFRRTCDLASFRGTFSTFGFAHEFVVELVEQLRKQGVQDLR